MLVLIKYLLLQMQNTRREVVLQNHRCLTWAQRVGAGKGLGEGGPPCTEAEAQREECSVLEMQIPGPRAQRFWLFMELG